MRNDEDQRRHYGDVCNTTMIIDLGDQIDDVDVLGERVVVGEWIAGARERRWIFGVVDDELESRVDEQFGNVDELRRRGYGLAYVRLIGLHYAQYVHGLTRQHQPSFTWFVARLSVCLCSIWFSFSYFPITSGLPTLSRLADSML